MADLHLSRAEGSTDVEVMRGVDVDDNFWLRVQAEWGREGPDPRRHILVPMDVFLGNMAWFADACSRHGVRPNLDDAIRRLLIERQNAAGSLEQARGAMSLSPEEVAVRLAGTRFTRMLRPFQVRDLGRQLALANGANFSVPGAGKTAVTYAVYEAERAAGRVEQILVIAPLSAFDAWFTEAADSFNDPPAVARFDSGDYDEAEVLLVNYHRLANSYDALATWVQRSPTMIVLDEAHRMKKGWAGQHGRYCLSLALLASRRDVLTGTPAPQSPADLVAQFDYLWPGQGARILPTDVRATRPAADIGHRVAASIRPLFTRTTKPELDLPEVVYNPIRVPLKGIQEQIYRALKVRFTDEFDLTQTERVDLNRMGQVVMYLLEAATNPKLLAAGGAINDIFRHPPLDVPESAGLFELIQTYPQHETPAKFVELAKLVRNNVEVGRKTLVWTNFVRNIVLLREQLGRYNPATIYGAIPSTANEETDQITRESELRRFRNDPDCTVLIANPAAMSEGVSLHTVCHDAIYLDRTFNAGHYLQSLDRIHRLGLPPGQETRITFLLTEGTVDEVVDSRIRDKTALLSEMLSDPAITFMSLPDEDDYGVPVDTGEDLVALFAHLRGGDGAD